MNQPAKRIIRFAECSPYFRILMRKRLYEVTSGLVKCRGMWIRKEASTDLPVRDVLDLPKELPD